MRLIRQPVKEQPLGTVAPTTNPSTKRKDPPKPWGFPLNFEEPISNRPRLNKDIMKLKVNGKYPLAALFASRSFSSSERDLNEVVANHSVHLWRFNIVRKALFVMLDDNQIELALFKTSKVRRLNNDFIHSPNEADEAFAATLQQLPEATKDMKNALTEEESVRYKRDIASLSDMMYQRENYFEESRNDVEKVMDEHMKTWVKLGQPSTTNGINPDANVLLSWLNDLNPVE